MGLVSLCAAVYLLVLSVGESNAESIHPLSKIQSYQHTVEFSSDLKFSWSIDNDQISAELQLKRFAWSGFGLSPYGEFGIHGMPYADFVIARWNTTYYYQVYQVFVNDYYRDAAYPGQPSLDTELGGQNNVLSYWGTRDFSNATSIARWTRKLDTGDKYDAQITSGDVYIIWAHGGGDDFLYHGLMNRGMGTINFYTGQYKDAKEILKRPH